jgi:hypothetical protein
MPIMLVLHPYLNLASMSPLCREAVFSSRLLAVERTYGRQAARSALGPGAAEISCCSELTDIWGTTAVALTRSGRQSVTQIAHSISVFAFAGA